MATLFCREFSPFEAQLTGGAAAFCSDVTKPIVSNHGNANSGGMELLDAKNSNKGIAKISVRDGLPPHFRP